MIYVGYIFLALYVALFYEGARNILSRNLQTTRKSDKDIVKLFQFKTKILVGFNLIVFLFFFPWIMNNPGKTVFIMIISLFLIGYWIYTMGQTEDILSTKEGKKQWLNYVKQQRIQAQKNQPKKFR